MNAEVARKNDKLETTWLKAFAIKFLKYLSQTSEQASTNPRETLKDIIDSHMSHQTQLVEEMG